MDVGAVVEQEAVGKWQLANVRAVGHIILKAYFAFKLCCNSNFCSFNCNFSTQKTWDPINK
jgi:hypothetical protein